MAKKRSPAQQHKSSFVLKDIILGGQDGLVNILALVLGVAAATSSQKVVIVSGLAALFAESIAMGAVAYTSSKSAYDYYTSMLAREKEEVKKNPQAGKKEIREIYKKKGFRGELLSKVVSKITSNKKIWVDTMMAEELNLFPTGYRNPWKNAFIVGFASVGGSLIPLLPFMLVSIKTGIYLSFVFTISALIITGIFKAKITEQNPVRCSLELAIIGTLAAIAGHLVGVGLDKLFF
ncbi:hypothetical protein GF358_04420 [Candidatus Woesearchaeota archaeon]|nr:hypothetical protein [Candidatus Woesearchaeota archaeon]